MFFYLPNMLYCIVLLYVYVLLFIQYALLYIQ